MRWRYSALVLVGLTACGGSSTTGLTCDLLADPTNCWADLAAQIAACLPSPADAGVLSADRTSCSFADGTEIRFGQALPVDMIGLDHLGFSIEQGGATCATVLDTFMNRIELTVGDKMVVSELHPGGRFHLHCDDGTSYAADFDQLFSCQPGTLPTDGITVSQTEVSFTLSSAATTGKLFSCAPAP